MAHTVSGYSQIYHLISPLYPNETNKLQYGKLYIFDSAETKKNGLKTNQTKGVWPRCCNDKLTHFLSHTNKSIK
jgi:hypothetical protein